MLEIGVCLTDKRLSYSINIDGCGFMNFGINPQQKLVYRGDSFIIDFPHAVCRYDLKGKHYDLKSGPNNTVVFDRAF